MEGDAKRKLKDVSQENEDDEWIGPMPSEAVKPKKRKVLEHEKVYLDNLPDGEFYERSFMHQDVITHITVTKTDFIITASCDGHVKFWKKETEGIEFVKHFRSHLGNIQDVSGSDNGELFCTISDDKSLKVFDIVNFDMINMMKLGYVPQCCSWIYAAGDAIAALAVAEAGSCCIHVYDGRGSEAMETIERLHSQPVVIIRYNAIFETVVSVDKSGMLEYWTGPKYDYKFPKNVEWEYKTDTDLYEFVKTKTTPVGLTFSPNGRLFATLARDRKVRIFRFLTGKMTKVVDESLKQYTLEQQVQQMKQQLSSMEFGRRVALEHELEKSDAYVYCNIIFDESGHFVLYSTMLGVKVINLKTNRCVRMLGKLENCRLLQVALFQGSVKTRVTALTMEMQASENPLLLTSQNDPTLFCTAYKKNRFYIFSRRPPADTKGGDNERDVFNEKPSKEELAAATQDISYTRISEAAVMYTSMGDIHIKLFPKECPKTVENFCVHSRNGYYNGHLFHRVIKGFMVQTGDPQGNGTGGESVWGGEFEDEFHPSLKHDRPYTLSMANAGANTNGSQFFITVAP
ncbi:hypothetical protein NP493_407g04016 [Ridgeia piscesae]|uniref:peptidylprolyl isomerase n=1 Tax=Ridgeia piscesae TaxID=27915 RepID=A0AAD9NSW0_RIDPI|nr:hypothetical protein NP493_407g04016 [Ridgeia piscesae]